VSYLTAKLDSCKRHEKYALTTDPLIAHKPVVLSENFALLAKLLK